MRHLLTTACLVSSLVVGAHDHPHDHNGSSGLDFHENKGQWPQQVLYRAMTPGGAVFVEADAFTHVIRSGGKPHASPPNAVYEPLRMHAYRVSFIGGHAKDHSGTDRRTHYANYFLGNDPQKWAGGVGVYGGADLHDVYPGIDLHVDGATGLKYDWLLRAGADASVIRLRFNGQDAVQVRDGMVYIGTTAGQVIEQRPVAWNIVGGERRLVKCEYEQGGDEIGYRFPDGYDKRYPLVIDPTVIFGSYIGSVANNFGFTATYDNDGSLYGGAIAFGVGWPVTLGVLQPNYAGDVIDMAISKFAPDGASLIWSTYIGGTFGNESPHSMVVNENDELYVFGVTGSSDFPTTAGCFDSSFGAGPAVTFIINEGYSHFNGADAVIVHLSADATQLLGSTYLGGSQADGLNNSVSLDYNYGDPFRGEIVLDQQERPIVVTSTISPDMPVSPNATQPTLGGGQDGYVCLMDPTLSTLVWGTYHGGSSDDSAFGVQQASDGRIYITGGTMSSNLPMAGTPYQGSWSGAVDGYIARYEADGSSLTAATYLGTSAYDQTYFVQIDLAGFIYVVGQSHGSYPVSTGVYANPNGSQFIHKLDHDLSSSIWSTRVGTNGTEDIAPSAFLVSDCGQIYFSGWGGTVNQFDQAIFSTTVGLPTTPDAIQSATDGSDFYLMVLNADAASLAYATFYGGSISPEHVDGGTSRFDKQGVVYQAVCAGCWNNSDFPTTPGAWSNTNNAGVNACNLGVFKIDFEQSVQVNIDASITATGACITEPIVFSAVGTATQWSWDLGDGTLSTETTLAHLYAQPGIYNVMLIGIADIQGLCEAIDTAYLEVTVLAPADLQPAFDAVPSGSCDAFSVQLANTSTGSTTYYWDFGDGTTSTQTNPVHAYATPGVYTITLALIDPVCTDTAFLSVDVPVEIPGITIELTSPLVLCDGGSVNINAGGGYDSYSWSTGEQQQIITVSVPGDVWVEVADGFCVGSDTVTVLAETTYPPLLDVELCPGQTQLFQLPFTSDQVLWSDGSGESSLLADAEGIYWYTAIDQFGCSITDTVLVEVNTTVTGEPIVPNVFTPNGDLYNEKFRIANIDAAEFKMDIYNRWGMKVFSSTNNEVGWNGKLDNGSDAVPDGTYFVIVTYKAYCSGQAPITKTGHVTLLR
ncbi:MAG: gliding motility-associated C-terminal domain-containing protein [Flavobacteriales bacterium]|nr:gliding motility-associated C-terminal domain-containing protein [Flavobacteriales bacterium]